MIWRIYQIWFLPHGCCWRLLFVLVSLICTQLEKEEKRRKNMAKARKFDAGFQRELELRRQELQQEQEQEAR